MPPEPKPPTVETPITENTRAIINAIARLETRLDRLQDVGEAIREIQKKAAQERETWQDVIYRIVTNLAGLLKSKPSQENQNRGNMPDNN